jgi:hypothetical protein
MKRSDFEEMVEGVLLDMTKSMVDEPIKKGQTKKRGIGGLIYGEAERNVAHAVSRLAAANSRINKPLMAPAPEMVPPCF